MKSKIWNSVPAICGFLLGILLAGLFSIILNSPTVPACPNGFQRTSLACIYSENAKLEELVEGDGAVHILHYRKFQEYKLVVIPHEEIHVKGYGETYVDFDGDDKPEYLQPGQVYTHTVVVDDRGGRVSLMKREEK